MTYNLKSLAFIGLDHSEFGNGVAVSDLHALPTGRPGLDVREYLRRDVRLSLAHVYGNAGGLDLKKDFGRVTCDLVKRTHEPGVQRAFLLVKGMNEPRVELRAVAADQMHFGREP